LILAQDTDIRERLDGTSRLMRASGGWYCHPPMKTDLIAQSDGVLVRRAVLTPGDATPWHTDACRRFSVVLHGQRLRIEHRDGRVEEVIVSC